MQLCRYLLKALCKKLLATLFTSRVQLLQVQVRYGHPNAVTLRAINAQAMLVQKDVALHARRQFLHRVITSLLLMLLALTSTGKGQPSFTQFLLLLFDPPEPLLELLLRPSR